ncbi:hypothetical protein GCM10020221_11440 [Streptomyces thioluteus]|uniref:DUF1488 domain-containing protein n=1 Tax=Streptomyces thioluteus TaxID=66431 RepID=A0ABN3WKJ9_STRTU
MTSQHAGFTITFQATPELAFTFSGETPNTVGPNFESFVRAAPRYAALLEEARAAFQIGSLGATVIHTIDNQPRNHT